MMSVRIAYVIKKLGDSERFYAYEFPWKTIERVSVQPKLHGFIFQRVLGSNRFPFFNPPPRGANHGDDTPTFFPAASMSYKFDRLGRVCAAGR